VRIYGANVRRRPLSGGVTVAATEFVQGDPTPRVVAVGDPAEPPVAFVVGGVHLAVGGFGVGEQAAGLVPLGLSFGLVLEGEAPVVFCFDDPVVVRAQQLTVADAGDATAGARLDVVDVALVGRFVTAGGVLAVLVSQADDLADRPGEAGPM
jgi:hypothetical protein